MLLIYLSNVLIELFLAAISNYLIILSLLSVALLLYDPILDHPILYLAVTPHGTTARSKPCYTRNHSAAALLSIILIAAASSEECRNSGENTSLIVRSITVVSLYLTLKLNAKLDMPN